MHISNLGFVTSYFKSVEISALFSSGQTKRIFKPFKKNSKQDVYDNFTLYAQKYL